MLVETELSDGMSGNLSVRRENGTLLITPTSVDFRLLTDLDLVEVDPQSGRACGRRRPSSEWRLHALIYDRRPDVNAVVHHHGPWASSVAVARKTIPVLVDEAVDIGPIPTVAYAPSASEELARVAAAEFEAGRNAILLANHGPVVVGRSLTEAMRRAVQVERSAKIYIGAILLGGAHELDATAVSMSLRFFEGYRTRPEEDEFGVVSARVAGHVRFIDLVNYSFRAGIGFASLVQTLIEQKLHGRS